MLTGMLTGACDPMGGCYGWLPCVDAAYGDADWCLRSDAVPDAVPDARLAAGSLRTTANFPDVMMPAYYNNQYVRHTDDSLLRNG